MAADDLIIANLALDLVQDDPISSIDQNSATGDAIRRNLPEARRFVLYGHPWKVAMELALLPANAVAPLWGFARAFDLPSNCARPFYVAGEETGDGSEWTMRGHQILTDLPAPLPVEYISTDKQDSARDPMLQKGIAIELARRIGPSRNEDEARADRLDVAWEKCIREARSVSSIIGSLRPRIKQSHLEVARFGGANVDDPFIRRFSS